MVRVSDFMNPIMGVRLGAMVDGVCASVRIAYFWGARMLFLVYRVVRRSRT